MARESEEQPMIRILHAAQVLPAQIFARPEERRDVAGDVARIIEAVRLRGDAALLEYARKFDGADLTSLEVPSAQLDAAVAALDPALRAIMEEAADNIRDFHRRQVRQSFVVSERVGVVLGQKVTPIQRVGLYIPGGTAAYPSSVLMNCTPARIAGCRDIIMVSPPAAAGT